MCYRTCQRMLDTMKLGYSVLSQIGSSPRLTESLVRKRGQAGFDKALGATSPATLAQWVVDARGRTFELVADLDDPQLVGPRLSIVNPFLWEIGHVAWFQEKWVLRHALGEQPLRPAGDALCASAAVAHDTRWELPLPTRKETLPSM